jgi:hypothetical protein
MNHYLEIYKDMFYHFNLVQGDVLQACGVSVRKFKRLEDGVEYTLW